MRKFDRISTFVTVIEENGFAAAARKYGISTPAISRQIAALEKELGAQLIRRSTRHIALTEIGEKYYQQCKKTLGELYEAELEIAESKNQASGSLAVLASRYFAIVHLLPKLSEFMRQNPALHVKIELAERLPNFEKEEIDIVFGVSADVSSELVRRRIATTRYILCASPDYLKKYGKPKKPSDLLKHRYIAHEMRKPRDNIFLKNEQEICINSTLTLNDTFAMRECAIQGMGIVNLHDYMVADPIREGKLVEILSEYQEPKKNVYLYFRQSRYLQPKIRHFIDFYTQES